MRFFPAARVVLPMYVLLSSGLAFAQPVARPSAADTAWQAITTLRRPVTPTVPTPPATPVVPGAPSAPAVSVAKITPAQLQAADKVASDRARQVSSAAKDFYTQFPTHANAGQARKLEATSALSGLKSATPAQEQAALRVAGDFRQNKSNPPEDRFEVALAMDRFQATKTQGGKPLSKNPQAYERLADNLRVEFGDRPEVFRLYAGIAHQVETTAGHALAKRIIQMPAAISVKSQAQDLIERHALLGRPLDLQLTTLNGRKFDLKKPTSGPTVLYVWSAGKPDSFFKGLGGAKKNAPLGTQWVYLFLGTTAAQLEAAKSRAPYAGTLCYEPPGTIHRVDDRLNVRASPFVFVLNRHGILTGYGRVDELATLLAAANR